MKISYIADCHLNKSSYKDDESFLFTSIPFRSQDFMKSLEYMVDKNINEIKPDLIMFLGDIYDTFDPSNIVTAFFSEQLRKIADAKIPVIIIVGNHDICSKHHALLPLLKLNLKNIKVVENPQSVKFKDKLLLLFPYSVDVERKNISIKDQFKQFVETTKEKINGDPELQSCEVIFVGHFGVKGACLNKSLKETDDKKPVEAIMVNDNEKDISIEDLDSIGARYVVLGDYHKHQILPTKKCLAMYPGSIERTDMSEANDKKGFVVYDSDKEIVDEYEKFTFIEYPNVRPMIDLVGNLSEIHGEIGKMNDSHKGAIVRITVKGNSQEIVEFDIGQQEVMKALNSKISPAYTKKRNKVVDVETKKKAEEVENKIGKEGHVSSGEVLDIVKEILSERSTDEEERNQLFSLADEIFESAKLKLKV